MSTAAQAGRKRRAEDRTAMELEGQGRQQEREGLLSAGAEWPAGGGNDLRSRMQAAMILGVSVWGLAEAKVFQTLLWSSRIDSGALAVAVLAASVVVLLWGYLDLYVGAIQARRVQYHDSAATRRITHAILLSLVAAGVALNVALWPAFRLASPVLVAMLSFGVLFQMIILFPPYIFNPLFLAGFAVFVYLWTR